MSNWPTVPTEGPHVLRMWCPRCRAAFTFQPPVWLGDPWPREEAERVQRAHMALAHNEAGGS